MFRKKKEWKSPYIKTLVPEKRNYGKIQVENSPYKLKSNLLNSNEIVFYKDINYLLENTNYVIFPKVRLADVIYVNTKYNFTLYFNKIGTKSIDLLVCDKNTLAPLIAIYLDDIIQYDEDMIEDRKYIEFCLREANIKVVRFNINIKYDYFDIEKELAISSLRS